MIQDYKDPSKLTIAIAKYLVANSEPVNQDIGVSEKSVTYTLEDVMKNDVSLEKRSFKIIIEDYENHLKDALEQHEANGALPDYIFDDWLTFKFGIFPKLKEHIGYIADGTIDGMVSNITILGGNPASGLYYPSVTVTSSARRVAESGGIKRPIDAINDLSNPLYSQAESTYIMLLIDICENLGIRLDS